VTTIRFEPLGVTQPPAYADAALGALKVGPRVVYLPALRVSTYDLTADAELPPLGGSGLSGSSTGGYAYGRLPFLLASAYGAYCTADLPPLRGLGSTGTTGYADVALGSVVGAGTGASTVVLNNITGYGLLSGLRGEAEGKVVVIGTLDSALPATHGLAWESIPTAGYVGANLPAVEGIGYYDQGPPTNAVLLMPWAGHMSIISEAGWTYIVSITERINASFGISSGFLADLRERLGIANTPVSILSTAIALEDTLAIRDVLKYALDVVLAEAIHLVDDVAATRRVLAQITERLVLTGAATSTLDAQVTLATALVLGDEVAAPFLAALTETLDLGETLDVRITRVVALLEELQLADAATAGLTVVANVDETLLLADAGDTQLSANVLLREALECFGTLSINGDVWSCWLINTESKGVARYTNFPFNSFAKAPWGAYVGATDTGLYELGGDTDDGEPITARIRSALTDFGDRRAKRVPTMYVGYTATGQMGLKVISTSESGVKTEDHYLLEPRPATGGVRESRFKVGRGIASVYLGFEVVNVGGADFALDVVEWLPIRLDRRVR